MRMMISLAAAVFLAIPHPAAAQCQRTGTIRFDYPRQRLDEALQRFAHSTGCPIRFDAAKDNPRRVARLRGRFTPDQAIMRLTAGIDLIVLPTVEGYAVLPRDPFRHRSLR